MKKIVTGLSENNCAIDENNPSSLSPLFDALGLIREITPAWSYAGLVNVNIPSIELSYMSDGVAGFKSE